MAETREARNKDVVRRHIEEAINGRKPELWDELMGDGYDAHHPAAPPGREGYRGGFGGWLESFPDFRIEIQQLIAEGEFVVARYIERATQHGPFMGFEPADPPRSYEKNGITIYRLADGKMQEGWSQEDDQAFFRGLGLPNDLEGMRREPAPASGAG